MRPTRRLRAGTIIVTEPGVGYRIRLPDGAAETSGDL